MQEVFRIHPIIPWLIRQTGKDLVIPLSDPIQDVNGKTVHEVFLRKGTRIYGNITAYNRYKHLDHPSRCAYRVWAYRHPDIWGPDPHVFRPERWLDMKQSKIRFGVYGNL